MNLNETASQLEELHDLACKVKIAQIAEAIEHPTLQTILDMLKVSECLLTEGLSCHILLKQITTALGEYG